jgi:hypothetical protein
LKKYFIFLLVVSSFAGRATAYTLVQSTTGNVPNWLSMPIQFWINQSGSPQISNGSEFQAVQAAFQTWQNVSIANVSFQYMGTTAVPTVGQDGLSVVTFVDSSVPIGLETVAAEFSFYTIDGTGNATMQEADIALSTSLNFSTSAEAGKYDIQSVVTHEVGHLLGLDHSALLSSVMSPYPAPGQLDQRTLSYDDMAGLSEFYSQSSDFSTLGAIGGIVTLGGNGVFGAHVVAVDSNGTPVASVISNSDGSYEIDFLPPGTYKVYAEPLDGPVTEQNIGGTSTSFYTGLQTNFGTTYFGDVSSLTGANSILLTAGRFVSAGNIHVLAAGGPNLTAPANYAVHIPAGGQATLTVGGSGIVVGDSFSASNSGITLGTPVFGGGISSTAPSSAQIPISLSASTALGPKNITVSGSGGTSVLSGGIVIVNPVPSNIQAAPTSGTVNGGTGVSITGQNFRSGAQVYFGGLAASNVQVVDSTTIQAVTPVNAAGPANVVVVNSDGTWGVETSAFTYSTLPPQISSVSPMSGPPATIVVISGSEFSSRLSDVSVRFNGAAGNVVSTSRTSVTALVPFNATTGPITLSVAGQSVTGPAFTVTTPATSTNLAQTTGQFIDASAGTALTFSNNDDAGVLTTIPFSFTLFSKTYEAGSQIAVSTNGWISLDAFTQPQFQSGSLPGSALPPALIAPFFTDLFLPGGANVFVRTAGASPNRQFVVEWMNAGILDSQGNDLGSSVTFEAILFEGSNDIQFIYSSMNGSKSDGSSATIGIQDSSRTQGVLTGYNQSVVSPGTVFSYHFVNGAYTAGLPAMPIDNQYTIPNLGGISLITDGAGTSASTGFATILPSIGNTSPSGVSIFSYKPFGIVVSEAGVPAAAPLLNGRIYAEANGPVNTGLAIANPNNQAATISYYFTDTTGTDSHNGTLTVPANGHVSEFLNDPSLTGVTSFQGTFTFSSNVPVGVIALRENVNQRGEYLMSTLPVTDLSAATAATWNTTALLPHFADGGGWITQVILVNPTNSTISGIITFVTPAGQTIGTTSFSIPQHSSFKQVTPNTSPTLQSGSIQITPSNGSTTPASVAIFSDSNGGGVTESEASVLPTTGTALRMYVEGSGVPGAIGSINSGVALANTSGSTVTVTYSLTDLTGKPLATRSADLPANGQSAQFITDIFQGLTLPVKGVLRVSTSSSAVSVLALRGRYNERGEFLMSTTPPTNEGATPPASSLIFAQIANGGGFTTQFVLFSGTANQTASGDLHLTYAN